MQGSRSTSQPAGHVPRSEAKPSAAAVPVKILPLDAHNAALVANVHPPDWKNPTPDGRYNLVVIGAGTAGLITSLPSRRKDCASSQPIGPAPITARRRGRSVSVKTVSLSR